MLKRKIISLSVLFGLLSVLAVPLWAAEFKTDDFSVQYPWTLEVRKGASDAVKFFAIDPKGSPWELVIVFPAGAAATFTGALQTAMYELKDFKPNSPKEIVTADGTKALFCEAEFVEPTSGLPGAGVYLGVQKNGKWYIAAVNTVSLGSAYDYDEFLKFVKSIKFKK